MTPPRVLIVAGSDSGGGAGIQADIKTVTMLGGYAMTAVTALTAQNTLDVQAIMTVPTGMVLQQIDAVVADLGVDAVKIGMIGSVATAAALADRLAMLEGVPIIFDPVMVATSGSVLADDATIAAFELLMDVAAVVTPNLPELERLVGRALPGDESVEEAALELFDRFGCAVLAKGGHATGDTVIDLLVWPEGTVRIRSRRLETSHTHGTGCTLASGVAVGLGGGLSLPRAMDRAIAYVQAALQAAPGLGRGHGPIGHGLGMNPFHHWKAVQSDNQWDVAAFDARWS